MSEDSKLFVPPNSLDTEKSLLGAILSDGSKLDLIIDKVKSEDFYYHKHQIIYDSIISISNKREPIDLITITNHLENIKELESIGGVIYLSHLIEFTPVVSNVEQYAEIILQKSLRRKLLKVSQKISQLAIDQSEETDELIDKVENSLFEITSQEVSSEYSSIDKILLDSFERLEQMHHHKGGLKGLRTGFTDLDNLLAGLHKSDLIIVAARPSMGKSSLAMNIARQVLDSSNSPICYFSLEMSKEQLVDRLLASESRVDSWKIRTHNLNDNDYDKMSVAMDSLAKIPLFIDDSAGLSITEIRTKARRIQMQHGLGLIIIDYLQLMSGRTSKGDHNRVQEISEISRGLKSLARELNIPIIALSQLSRTVESRRPQIPQLADLRESGSIEQDADIVMFIYRKGHYEPDTEEPNLATIMIKKHRNGPLGDIKLYWHDKFTQFQNYSIRK